MQPLESPITPLTVAALRMIICKRPVPPDDHLQEASPSVSSFARGQPLRMTICKRSVPSDHHLQEAGPSGWSSARGRSLWIIICKRPTTPDDHLQEAGPSGSSFSRGQPLWMTICKRPVPPRMIVCKSLAPRSKLRHPLESNWKCIDHTCNQDATNSPWSYNATNDKDIHCNHLCVYNSFIYLCGICIRHSSVSWLCTKSAWEGT